MSAFSSLDLFYELDERRRRSPELDYGVWWRYRRDGFFYRVSWVADTGELIAVRLSRPTVHAIGSVTHEGGLAIIGGDELGVYVLAIIELEGEVERLLHGWEEICGDPNSLAWLAVRVAAPPLCEVLV